MLNLLNQSEVARNFKEKVINFINDEKGVSGIVIAVMLILVSVLVVNTFQENLTTVMNEIWAKIMEGLKS